VVTSDRNRFDGPVFLPVADYGLRPDKPVKCPRLLGYGFWEFNLNAEAAKINSERYYWIFAGSEWCADRVRKASGASNVSALIQGVDFSLFTPQPWPEKRNGFRVFSGGKYEFRKAQDIVISSMKVFMDQRKDVVLVTSWNNPWPETMKTMDQSWLIEPSKPLDGLDEKRIINLKALPNSQMPGVYGECDCGLFPNRCEAGTNLVMCEMMACGRPVIASAFTGQGEVIQGYPLNIIRGNWDHAGWFNANVSDCLVQLERLYQNRALCAPLGAMARSKIEPYTWDRCAQEIVSRALG
jgi:glycosyltransferase involved in cell wall biosynthesis